MSDSQYKEYLPERDFTAYGLETPANCWPNGAKIAISFVLNYEEGAEHTLWNGDKTSEAFLNESQFYRTNVEGRRDLYVESQYEWGIRVGVPRLLKLFKKFGYSWTTWTNARALEESARYGPILVQNGHEIACHGNRWITQTELSGSEEEAAHVAEAIDRLRAATGLQNVPTGWYYGRGSLYNKHILAKVHKAKGVPLLYSSDSYADDVPYYCPSPLALDGEKDEGLLMIPYSLTNNDYRFMAPGSGFVKPDDFFNLLKSEFDYMYQEGLDGRPKLMTVAMHSRIVGKAARITALRKFMEYIKTKEDVWVTTRDQIAAHWRKEYPYVAPTRELHAEV